MHSVKRRFASAIISSDKILYYPSPYKPLCKSLRDNRDEFIDLWGEWSTDDVAEFNEKLVACESIDSSDWQ